MEEGEYACAEYFLLGVSFVFGERVGKGSVVGMD